MNRADQAPEPSIEELLASIRLIISDADKQGSFQREPYGMGAMAGAGLAAEEVFDLTDELVFPEEQVRGQAGAPQAGGRGQAGPEMYSGQAPRPGPHKGASPDDNQVLHADARQGGAAAVAQAVWSRRELPEGAAQAPAAPRFRQEPPMPRPQARSWAGDIQMPVSEQGPVPLFPAPPGNARDTAPSVDAPAEIITEAEYAESQGEGEGEVAVAVLAQRLARSAMGVLEARELETAKQVDFEHMDSQSKADVAEKFADAIEVAAHTPGEDTELLEVVEAQAIMEQAQKQRQAASHGNSAAPEAAKQEAKRAKNAPAPKTEAPAKPEAKPKAAAKPEPLQDAFAKMAKVPEPAQQASAKSAKAPEPATAAKTGSSASAAPPKPAAVPSPAAAQAPTQLVQAQFMGAAPASSSAPHGGPLETAVREMLRPLLVQWLNENMPRILENAIREEIAVRGLLPNSDG